MSLLNPTEAQVAAWIVQCRDADPLVRDLAASNLAAAFVQQSEAVRVLSAEVVRLREFERAVVHAATRAACVDVLGQRPDGTATLVPLRLVKPDGGAA